MSSNDTRKRDAGERFDVLGTMRALRDDEALTATQLVVLLCAVLRTDNRTCKVRMSIEGIAKDANVVEKTARTVFKAPAALRYLARVEGRTRAKDMWFHPIPVKRTGVEEAESNQNDPIPVSGASIPVTGATIPVTDTGLLPSLLPSPSTDNGPGGPVKAKKNGEGKKASSLPWEKVRPVDSSLADEDGAVLADSIVAPFDPTPQDPATPSPDEDEEFEREMKTAEIRAKGLGRHSWRTDADIRKSQNFVRVKYGKEPEPEPVGW